MESRKRSHKLLFQITAIVLPLFALMTAAIVWTVYTSTVNGFLDAQNDHIEDVTTQALSYLHFVSGDAYDADSKEWMFRQMEKYKIALNDDQEEERSDDLTAYLEADNKYEYSWFENMPEDIRYDFISNYLSGTKNILASYITKSSFDSMFIMDLDPQYRGFVLLDFNKTEPLDKMGSYLSLDLSEHPILEKILETGSEEMVFEKATDFPNDGNYYIGYKPVVINGKTRAVVGITYKWDSFRDSLNGTLSKAVLISVGGIVIVLAVLLIFLYRKAIKPLSGISKALDSYAEDNSTLKIVDDMQEIKTNNELGQLSAVIADFAVKIDHYTGENIRLAAERERVTAELDLATKIQADQLPNSFPDRTDFDIYASMTPAKEVGGDFYDFFFVDEDHLALVIADVSGKGVPAALFMMMSKNLIKDHAMMMLSPKEIAERVNLMLCENNKQDMFVTAWIGILELSTGKITAVNAGHENPAIRRPNGRFELFEDDHCFVLGGMKRARYKQYEFTLPKGSTLFLYTDGVTEATNASDEMFGEDRVVEALNRFSEVSVKELLEGVHAEINSFVGTAPQYDDITMLGIKLL